MVEELNGRGLTGRRAKQGWFPTSIRDQKPPLQQKAYTSYILNDFNKIKIQLS